MTALVTRSLRYDLPDLSERLRTRLRSATSCPRSRIARSPIRATSDVSNAITYDRAIGRDGRKAL